MQNFKLAYFLVFALSALTITSRCAADQVAQTSKVQCINYEYLTINGIGLFSKLENVKKIFGEPVRIEDYKDPTRLNPHRFYYNDLVFRVIGERVERIDLKSPSIEMQSRVSLGNTAASVQEKLGVSIDFSARKISLRPSEREGYHFPVCHHEKYYDAEMYVFFSFDTDNRLNELYVEYWAP